MSKKHSMVGVATLVVLALGAWIGAGRLRAHSRAEAKARARPQPGRLER